jgi:predicted dehydrogenase
MQAPSMRSDMSDRTFNWGIVGTGGIARQFAADLRLVPDARLAAVCSRDEARAAAFAAEFGVARSCADLDGFLADVTIDAVYLATPNSVHANQAVAAIKAGKPVLVEKPFAVSAAEARGIAAAAERRGVFAMEGLWTRFLPAVREAKRLVDEGRIGKVREIRAELAYRRTEAVDGRLFRPELGGGAALDLGVYPLSLAVHFLGRPTAVSGVTRIGPSGVDVRTDFRLGFDGAEARLSCGLDHDGDNRFAIVGSEGALRLEAPFLKAQRLTLFSRGSAKAALSGGGRSLLSRAAARLPLPGREVRSLSFDGIGLRFEVEEVMRLVRSGATQSAVMPLADSTAVLEIIDSVRSAG